MICNGNDVKTVSQIAWKRVNASVELIKAANLAGTTLQSNWWALGLWIGRSWIDFDSHVESAKLTKDRHLVSGFLSLQSRDCFCLLHDYSFGINGRDRSSSCKKGFEGSWS